MGQLMDKKEFKAEAKRRGYADKHQTDMFLKERKTQEIFVENDLIDLYHYAEFLDNVEARHIEKLFHTNSLPDQY